MKQIVHFKSEVFLANFALFAVQKLLTAKSAKDAKQTKRADCSALPVSKLLRRQFLGLALRTHELERALCLFVRLGNLFLHFGRSLFHFWR